MLIKNTKDLGTLLRNRRRMNQMSQQALADAIGTSRHWVIDLERGKPTLEIELVLRAIRALGLILDVRDSGLGLTTPVPQTWLAKAGTSRQWTVPDLAQVLTKARGLNLGGTLPKSRGDTLRKK